MNSLSVFIHFSEQIVSKLYQWNFWTDTIFKLKTRIKSIQKILSVFQYPHLIEATTLIYFVPVWMYSLFDSSQNVSHIYKQLLCWKSRSTCSILFCIWFLVKFCYSISTRKVIIFLVNQNIQWWDLWFVISQMFLFVITSVSVSRVA
jgi:hypothetical protein